MIDWEHMGENEAHGRMREKPDTTVFIASRGIEFDDDAESSWLLWGAFVPDAQEPAKYDTLSDAKAAATGFWLEFKRRAYKSITFVGGPKAGCEVEIESNRRSLPGRVHIYAGLSDVEKDPRRARRAVQICATGADSPSEANVVYALCDDGTIWFSHGLRPWVQHAPIPQGGEEAKS